jgi:hypothetical protein
MPGGNQADGRRAVKPTGALLTPSRVVGTVR